MQAIFQFINFLDTHSGSLTFLITTVYVIATIFICVANIKSANATKDQIKESKRQFEEGNRAFVTATFDIIRSGLLVLCIENHGKRIANNVNVSISEAFIHNVDAVWEKNHIERLCNASFTLGIGKKWYISLGSQVELEELSKEILAITISYEDNCSQYCEHTTIDLKQYFWALMYDSPTEDLYQEVKKQTKGMNGIQKELHQLALNSQKESNNA